MSERLHFRRGDIVLVDLGEYESQEDTVLRGKRPAIVVSSDFGARNSQNLSIIAGTHADGRNERLKATHIKLPASFGLKIPTLFKCEQIQTVPKAKVLELYGSLINTTYYDDLNNKLRTILGLDVLE